MRALARADRATHLKGERTLTLQRMWRASHLLSVKQGKTERNAPIRRTLEARRTVTNLVLTQPWLPNVVFRGLAPEEFRAFQEPGNVKIVWTLRADPVGESESMFRTETRVTTTDQTARTKFRWYWARFSPGIVLIRRVMLGLPKTDAERRALGRH